MSLHYRLNSLARKKKKEEDKGQFCVVPVRFVHDFSACLVVSRFVQ